MAVVTLRMELTARQTNMMDRDYLVGQMYRQVLRTLNMSLYYILCVMP
jgi:hypothetical protein